MKMLPARSEYCSKTSIAIGLLSLPAAEPLPPSVGTSLISEPYMWMTLFVASVANRTPNASTKTSVGFVLAFAVGVPAENEVGLRIVIELPAGRATYVAIVFAGAVL